MAATDIRPAPAVPGALYAAFWRWHFYAGLLILPVLMLMALTGGVYLFRGEIDDLVYRPLMVVEGGAGATSPQAWVDAANRVEGGRVVQLVPPATTTRSARLVVEAPDGARRDVFVDPHGARVLGDIPSGGVMQVIKRLHSLDLAGPVANMLVEVVAGWAIVMVATGAFLWWPRGQAGGVITLRGSPDKRLFWRDLHAVTGMFAAAVILFLAVTGMPWSQVWGAQVRNLTNEAGWGAPRPPAGAEAWRPAGHKAHAADADPVPWSLQGMDMSRPHRGHQPPSVSVNEMVARVEAAGMSRPYVLSIPKTPGKAWSAARIAKRAEDTRTLYLDGATGAVIADIRYGQYGPAAKAIQWGIAVHQGEQFGPLNRYIMLLGCVSVWLLGVSAIIMWWKRRPKGRLAAPPRPTERRAYWGLAAVLTPLALLYPLVGASLLLVLTLDLLIRRIALATRPPLETPRS